MQTRLEALTGLERRLDVAVPFDEIEAEISARLKRLAQTVKIRGFRPGKVPLKIVAQQYGGEVRKEVLGDTVQKTFTEAVNQQQLRVAGYPRIEAKTPSQDAQAFEFSATFEVYPKVEPGDISDVTIERPLVAVSDTDLEKTIDILRKQRRYFEPVDRAGELGDEVMLSYDATIDGAPFEGGKSDQFLVELGAKRTLPEFEQAIEGLKAGDTKTFDVTFPGDYGAADIAGKTAVFNITIKQVSRPVLPEVNDQFAQQLGIADGDLAKMRAEIHGNLEREVGKKIAARIKEQVMEALLKATPIDLPKSLVDIETQRLAEQARKDLEGRGVDLEKAPVSPDLFAEQARRRVALGLILTEIVKAHDLKPSPDAVRAKIDDYAKSFEHPDQVVRWYYEDRSRLAEVESLVLEDAVVAWALERAKVVDTTVDFDDIMGLNQ